MVCVRSVEAAREVFENIPVKEDAIAVQTALDTLARDYNDSDGEYTSKGLIGDVELDIYSLLESQEKSGLIDIDRQEAEECLMAEMIALVPLAPEPVDDAEEVTIKTTITGTSGFEYFVKMTFEQASQGNIALAGHIYCNDSYQFPILDKRLERTYVETE